MSRLWGLISVGLMDGWSGLLVRHYPTVNFCSSLQRFCILCIWIIGWGYPTKYLWAISYVHITFTDMDLHIPRDPGHKSRFSWMKGLDFCKIKVPSQAHLTKLISPMLSSGPKHGARGHHDTGQGYFGTCQGWESLRSHGRYFSSSQPPFSLSPAYTGAGGSQWWWWGQCFAHCKCHSVPIKAENGWWWAKWCCRSTGSPSPWQS